MKCTECNSSQMINGSEQISKTIAGSTFTTTVAATICKDCGESFIDYQSLHDFNVEVKNTRENGD